MYVYTYLNAIVSNILYSGTIIIYFCLLNII